MKGLIKVGLQSAKGAFWVKRLEKRMSEIYTCSIETDDLKTEYCEKPLGIGKSKPVFSWRIVSEKRSQIQTAYRIFISSHKSGIELHTADIWDSGKIYSDETVNIKYQGVQLQSGGRYYWWVMAWDKEDRPSKWSKEAWFEMGLLEETDWKGCWIGGNSSKNPLDNAKWIGCKKVLEEDSKPEDYYFKKTFIIPSDKVVQQVVFDGTVDESGAFYINYNLACYTNTEWGRDWTSPFCYVDLTEKVRSGVNCISCKVSSSGKRVPAFIGRLMVYYTDDTSDVVETDDTWEWSEIPVEGMEDTTLEDATWKAGKILAVYGEEPWGKPKRRGPAPLLRKEFKIDEAIEKARLYICGLGYYELQLNGKRVGDSLLTTSYSQYDKTVYYSTYDVTELLNKGDNCVGIEIGRGYYAYQKDWIGTGEWLDEAKMLLQLEVELSDGKKQQMTSDSTWATIDGPTVDDNVWYGDKYDARLEKDGWSKAGYNAKGWVCARLMDSPKGILKPDIVQPIKITDVLLPVDVTNPSPNTFVYDFGKVTTGWARITVGEKEGTRIKLTYGEKLLPDGRVDMKRKNAVYQFWESPQVDIYICSNKEMVSWEPKFSYKGYRYIEVEGLDHGIDIKGVVLHNDLERTGSFECSNDLLNRIHGIITPTILNNFHSIPTDTPIYEKRGWTGDAQAIAETAMLNLDSVSFFRKWVRDLADSQSEEGEIPDTCPGPVYYPPAPEWMCAFIVIPWNLYVYYGDSDVLKEHYQAMRKYVCYEIERMKDNVSSNKYYGDWNAPSMGGAPPEGAELSSTSYVFYVCELMSKIAKILEMDEDSNYFNDICSAIKKSINDKFFNKQLGFYLTNKYDGYRQTSNILPLAFGIVPQEVREDVADKLAEDVINKGCHLDTGCFGTKFIAPVLSECGRADLAYAVASQNSYPGWGYWLENGATTCWETWETSARSYNHFYLGTIDEWFYKYLAGIQVKSAGFKEIVLRPYICGDLTYACGHLDTVRGRISSKWRKDDHGFTWDIEIPANTIAKIYIPDQGEKVLFESGRPINEVQDIKRFDIRDGYIIYLVGSGRYHFH